jgi:hypothetical protein
MALATGFLVRSILAYTNCQVMPLPGAGTDSVFFEELAWYYAENGFATAWSEFSIGSRFYPWLIGLIYCGVGRNALLIHLVNALLGTLIAWNVHRTALMLWGSHKVAIRSAWIITLLPSMCIFSSIILREAAIGYLVSLGAMYFVKWRNTQDTGHISRCFICFLGSFCFHTGMIAGLIVLTSIIAWTGFRPLFCRHGFTVLKTTATACGIAVAVGVIWTMGIGLEKLGSRDVAIQERVWAHQEGAARSRAAYLEEAPISSPTSLILQLPVRVIYFLFTPFPWMVRTISDVIGFFDACIFFALCVGIWRSRAHLMVRPGAIGILLVLAGLLAIFSIGTSNYGTSIRHKTKLSPLFVCLIAPKRPRGASSIRARLSRRL